MPESVVVDHSITEVKKAVKFPLPEHLVILCYSGNLTAKVKNSMACAIEKFVAEQYQDNPHALPFSRVVPDMVGDGWGSSKIQNFTIERWTRKLTEHGKEVNLKAEPKFRIPESASYVSLSGRGWRATGFHSDEVVVVDVGSG